MKDNLVVDTGGYAWTNNICHVVIAALVNVSLRNRVGDQMKSDGNMTSELTCLPYAGLDCEDDSSRHMNNA